MSSFTDYFMANRNINNAHDVRCEIHSCPELIDFIQQVGFLPLLESGIQGYCAESLMAEECRFVQFDDGSWEWPLWKWKGDVIRESGCVYGKFFAGKAGFVSRDWWPDLCNWRRNQTPKPEEGSIEDAILATLGLNGSMISRDLRDACGLTGPKMRGKFDNYVNKLQMACYIVTEDFVYSRDKNGREYGFGLSLLTTPEQLIGRNACRCSRTPEESYQRMFKHLQHLLPEATEKQIKKMLK